MKLISRVELAYFRSFYKQKLDGCSGTNIIFGRNDSGKSNVLRALNLFFNDQTNPGLPFNFDRDFCSSRSAEAGGPGDIRKFVYVKVWFDTPSSWQNSLGPTFWIKKQWSITREFEPLQESSISETRLQQYLTRFMKKVRFHYVPAIKDRRIFEYLLGEIYRVIAGHSEFSASLSDFAQALRDRTQDLSDGLQTGLGILSTVSPPDDLTDLFRSLDFETGTEYGESLSLTLQRGDGVQVRHIPAILAFLSDRSSEDYHIWGFEEPENSLELANAIQEARQFRQYGDAKNKQIFLTSHSPAFFSLDDPGVRRYFVSRSGEQAARHRSKLIPIPAGDSDSPSELMGETPHLPVISGYLKKADERIRALREDAKQLQEELSDRDQSIVFVEGESDVLVFSAAWDHFVGADQNFDFVSGLGVRKMGALAKEGATIQRLAPHRIVLVVVDNDLAGRELYKDGRLRPGGKWIRNNSNGVHWCRLPFTEGFRKVMQKFTIPEVRWPGTLENLFTPALRREAACDGALRMSSLPYSEFLSPEFYPKVSAFLDSSSSPDAYYLLKPEEDTKISFAEWIAARSRTDHGVLEPLRQVVLGIRHIMQLQSPALSHEANGSTDQGLGDLDR